MSDLDTGWAAPQIMGYPMNKATSIGKMRSHGVLGSESETTPPTWGTSRT